MRQIVTPLLLAIALSSIVGVAQADKPAAPRTVIWNAQRLLETKRALSEPTPMQPPAVRELYRQADSALKRGPYTVVSKTELPPSGDKHDYQSYGPYWWPNPETDDGLPYVRRDGVSNPDSKTSDRVAMNDMANDVATLSLAAYLSGDERYAQHACKLLHAWFVDPETKMSPHLEFGQAIPGITNGRGIGIIDTCSLVPVPDAIEVLRAAGQLDDKLSAGLTDWFERYLDWLQNSKHGRNEAATRNNHGTWYDVQCARFAVFVEDRKLAKKIVQAASERRIRPQFEPDGRQPHELARTKSLSYSVFNLAAAISLAKIGESLEIDLWDDQADSPGRLQAATVFLLPYLLGEAQWPYEQINGYRNGRHTPLILQTAATRYDRRDAAKALAKKSATRDFSALVGP